MANKKIKIGIVGCGAIGASLSSILVERFNKTIDIVALCDLDNSRAQALKLKLGCGSVVPLAELIPLSDLIVEAAAAKVSFDVAKAALLQKKDILLMSIAGVLGREKELFEIAEKNRSRIFFPSGAICGLDGIKALRGAGIDEIILKTYKPPRALRGADYVVKKGIDLDKIEKEEPIFSGTAYEAAQAFPQNINIVALLSIAAGGQTVPRVTIFVSPGLERNVHVIEVKSAAGRLTIKCENVPSPDNPKTSYLAVLSAVATISGISDVVRIGS